MSTSDNIAAISPLDSMTPIAHLVWRNVLVAPDDAVDYYEVARDGDKCADGSEPFPVYTAGDLSALVHETTILKAGIKRLSDEEELLAETTDGDEFTLVSIAAKLAAAEAALLAEARKAEAMKQALKMPFCVLFLDGRNEHGTHVLPSFPTSIDVVDDDLAEQAEAIMSAAEAEGFTEGDHVWAEFSNVPPQIGDEGRVELDGYWDFRGINKAMSTLLNGGSDAQG